MGKEWNQAQKQPRGWWWKAPLAIILLLSITLFIVIFNINSIALSQINSVLEKSLSTGGHLDSFNLQLLEGQLAISGLTLNPPEEFGSIAPIRMKSLKVSVETDSLFDQPVIINEIALDQLAITLVRDKQGQLSVLHILSTDNQLRPTGNQLRPKDNVASTGTLETKSNDSETGVEAPEIESKEPLPIPAMLVKSIRVNNLTLQVIDHLIGEEWTANVTLNMTVNNLQLNDLMNKDIFVDNLNLAVSKLNIDQVPGFSKTPLLTLDKISLTANKLNLNSPHITLNSLLLNGLGISIEQDSDRVLNIQQLISSWQPKTSSPAATVNTSPVETKTVSTVPPSISISNIKLDSVSAQLLSNVTPQQWRSGFDQLDIHLTDLGITQNNVTLGNSELTLKGVEIDQAPGFGHEKLLSLEQLSISTDQLSTAAEELLINKIALHALSSSIQTNAQGLSNIQALSHTLIGKSGLEKTTHTDASATDRPTEKSSPTPQKPLPVVNIGHLLMNNSSLTYSDAAIASKLMTFPLNNVELEVKQLRLFDANPKAAPASLSLALELIQPDSLPKAYIGAIAVIGPVNKGIPAINSQIRVGGFKLDTIDPLIPPSSRTALGADGFDAAVAIALDHQAINLNASVLSDQNIAYNAIAVKGPIAAPTIEMGAILAGVYSRFSDGLLNVGKGGFNAGLDIASSGVDIAEAVGSGTLSIGKNLGVSLFEAGTGLVTLDQQQLSQGLVDTSKGTLDIGYSAVTESSSAAKGGIQGSYHNLDGSSSLKAWNEGIKSRYEYAMQKAEGALLQMRYPPTIQ